MAKCGITNISGGGAASSDDCTATKNKVLMGYTAITKDSNDEVNEGTIPTLGGNAFGGADETAFDTSPIVGAANNNAVGAFDYPLHGYFDNDAVRVHIPNLLPNNIKAGVKVGGKKASLTGTFTSDANAQSSQILTGRSAYVNGVKVNGTMPIQNAETDGDRVWATKASNWAGTFNVGVRNGYYLNGVNWVRYDVPTYRPENIKKGVNIGGVIGTWEGWVPQPTDVYYRGTNTSLYGYGHEGNGSGTFRLETGAIRATAARPYMSIRTVNLSIYNRINVEFRFDGNAEPSYPLSSLENFNLRMKVEDSPKTFTRTAGSAVVNPGTNITLSVGLENLDMTAQYLYIYLTLAGRYWWDFGDDDYAWAYKDDCRFNGWVYRVWFS